MTDPTSEYGASRKSKIFVLILVLCLLTTFTLIGNTRITSMKTVPVFMEVLTKRVPKINLGGSYNVSRQKVSSSSIANCVDCFPTDYKPIPDILKVFGNYKFSSPDCYKKLLVYECTGAYCGGLADREKGIISSLLLAIVTNRTLVVDHRKPCDLQNYLLPNIYNWSKCMPYVAGARAKGNFYTSYIDGHGKIAKNFSNVKTGDIWNEQVATIHNINVLLLTRIRTHPDARQKMPWLFSEPIDKQISGLWHVLFQPVSKIQVDRDRYVKNFTNNGQLKMVGIHYRQDFIRYKIDFPVFLKLLERYTNKDKFVIYIATDNSTVKTKLTAKFQNVKSVVLNVSKPHVDTSGSNCDSLYYAVLEQQLLARSNVLLISRSGYAQYATYIRALDNGIFMLKTSNDKNVSSVLESVNMLQIAQKIPPTS